MTDREKLIELMRQVDACICNLCDGSEEAFDHSAGILADHLIANGVVVREKGEWATDKEDAYWGNSLKRKYCTRCKKRPHFDRETRKFILTDFCPNCGADMRNIKEEKK